jgi:GTP-binding protein
MRLSVCAACRSSLREQLRSRLQLLQSFRQASTFTSKSWYWDTSPPSNRQLAAAQWFFKQHPPRKAWTATEWRKNDNQETDGILVPEVAFLGRSNVGKSSLLNAILNSPGLNYVGPKPGKTKLLHAWGLAPSDPKTGGALKGWKGNTDTRVVVLDAPGYGYASRSDWGAEILNYMKYRKQLRRIFVLIDASHGVKKHDKQMLNMLHEKRIPHQLVLSKADRQKELGAVLRNLQPVAQPRGTVAGLGEILTVGGLERGPKREASGVADVQWAILRAAGLEDYVMEQYLRLEKDVALKHSDERRLPNAPSHLLVEETRNTLQEPPPPPISLGWSSDPIPANPSSPFRAICNPLEVPRNVSTSPPTSQRRETPDGLSRSSLLPPPSAPFKPGPPSSARTETNFMSNTSLLIRHSTPDSQQAAEPASPTYNTQPNSSAQGSVHRGMAGLQQATSPPQPTRTRTAPPTRSAQAGVYQGMAGLQEAVGTISNSRTRSRPKPEPNSRSRPAPLPKARSGKIVSHPWEGRGNVKARLRSFRG